MIWSRKTVARAKFPGGQPRGLHFTSRRSTAFLRHDRVVVSNVSTERRMVNVDSIPTTYAEAIQILASAHAAGLGAIQIFAVNDPAEQVVRLVEVSDDFPEAGVDRPDGRGGVERVVPVFPMNRSRDFPYRSEIAQVTRAEWSALRDGQLHLNKPVGDLASAREVSLGR